MEGSRMVGYWVPDGPVQTGRSDVLATTYLREDLGRALVAIGSWSPDTVDVHLDIDWKQLGVEPDSATIVAAPVRDFQEGAVFDVGAPIPVAPGKGWLLTISKAPPR
jgi:hypothetical protein